MKRELSVVIITLNEETYLPRCLEQALRVADEILIVDSGSTDKTQEIALNAKAKFLYHPFEGHIQQKNYARQQAKFDWVLSLDADEVLSDELVDEILRFKSAPTVADGYKLNRLTWYCGHWQHHGGFNPDWKLRLWQKNSGEWGGINPHDQFSLYKSGNITEFKGRLLHYSIPSLENHIQQINHFTTIAAQALYVQKKPSHWYKRNLGPIFTFFRNYFFKRGFLDGYRGFMAAYLSAFYVYTKYSKLKLLYEGISK